MSRPAKWLAGIVGVLTLLLLLGAGAIALLLDPDRVREQMVAAVKTQTGRELRIEQPVGLSYFPWLGVSLHAVSLGNAPGFGDEPLARLDELRVRLKVVPLFAGRLELDRLVLNGLALNLVRSAQGVENWRDRPGTAPSTSGTGGAAPPPQGGTDRGLAALLLAGVELNRCRIAWTDERAGKRYQLDDISLHTGAIAAGRAVPIRFATRVRLDGPSRDFRLSGTGNLRLGDSYTTVSAPDLAVVVTAEGEGLPAGGVEIQAHAGVDYDADDQSLAVAPLEIVGPAVRATGQLKGSALARKPTYEGRFEVTEAKPRELLALLGAGELRTTDPAVLGRAAGKVPFKLDGQGAVVEGLTLALDDTHVTGRLTVTDFAAPAVRFELEADQLDADRYLPPPREARPAPAAPAAANRPQTAGAVVAAGAALPAEVVGRLDLEGGLRIGVLKVSGARLSDVRTQWRARDGLITQTAEARLYGGGGRATSTLDARPAAPAMSIRGSLQGIDVKGLLADMTGKARVTGTGSIDVDLRWDGLAEAEIKKTLNGSTRFALHNGAIQGFNLEVLVRNALAAVKGGQQVSGPQQTEFSELTASSTVRNGVVSNRDLRARSALLQVTGEGTIDLPTNRIDYLALATVVEGAQRRLGINVKELEGAAIPVRFTGSLDDPTVRLDVDEVLKSQARQQIERKVEEKLKGEWGDKLKKFFGR